MTTTDTTRRALIDVACSYLDALVSHDSASVKVAEEVRRIGNGTATLSGAAALRNAIEREPVAALGARRWVVEPPHVAVVYDLEADLTRAEQSEVFASRSTWIPTYVAERFTVVDGLITEIEVVYAATAVGDARPPRPERYPRVPDTSRPSRTEVVETATAYLDALVSHDGSAVPLAPLAWRVENGRNTGDSGAAIATALGASIMHVVTAVRDAHWFVEGETAIVFYTIDVDLGRLPDAPPDASTTAKRLGERFRVVDGMIAEIEAVIPANDIRA